MHAKISEFEPDLQQLAQVAKVFSHPARLAILRLLAKSQNCISGDIAEQLPLSRTTVSQHLQELKKLGLIKGTTSGLKISYCIDYEEYNKQKQLFEMFLQEIENLEPDTKICCDL